MIPDKIKTFASELGFARVGEVTLSNGETAYLLVADSGAMVGLPVYLHYENGVIRVSDATESMNMLNEPGYLDGDY